MTEPTKGLRLAFEPGITGLKFIAGDGKAPYPEDNGPTDLAYINWLIETDEARRERAKQRAASPSDLMVDMGNLEGTERKFTAMLQKLDGGVENQAYEEMVEEFISSFNHIVLQGIDPLVALYAMSQGFAIVLGFALRANLPFPIAQTILAQQMKSATASEQMVRVITGPAGHG